MAHNLVDVDTWTAAVTVPDDGDAASAITVETAAQDLGDRTLYLRNRLPGAAASYIIELPLIYTINTDARFSYGALGTYIGRPIHSDVTSAGQIYCPLTGLPSAGTVTNISLRVTGLATAGAHAGLVGTAPWFSVERVQLSTLVLTAILGATSDPYASTDLGLYEAPHAISSGAMTEALSSDRTYHLIITGEAGANATANKFAVYAAQVTITP